MITAVDTNVLLDVFTADQLFGRASHGALTRCLREGSLIVSDAVWAELGAGFPSAKILQHNLDHLSVTFVPLDQTSALAAGHAWRRYRDAGGTRRRILADFLIGAHALLHADRLLTRDRGFFGSHFTRLSVLDPSADTA